MKFFDLLIVIYEIEAGK